MAQNEGNGDDVTDRRVQPLTYTRENPRRPASHTYVGYAYIRINRPSTPTDESEGHPLKGKTKRG